MRLHYKIKPKELLKDTWDVFCKSMHPTFSSYLVFFDINNLKGVNDVYGHIQGDFVIKRISQRVLTSLRNEDAMVRFGGDEFIILIPNITKEFLKTYLEKIQSSVADDNYLLRRYGGMHIAIGAVPVKADSSLLKIIENADVLMYQAKANVPSYTCVQDVDKDFVAEDRRDGNIYADRKRMFFSWVVNTLKHENPKIVYKLLLQVARTVFTLNDYKMLMSCTPNSTLTSVMDAYNSEVRKILRKERPEEVRILVKGQKYDQES